jgi:DNA repair protein RecN (Recombination protein N)
VHGQNPHQALLKQSSHIGYLERYAGAEHLENLAAYRESYSKLSSLESEREMAGIQGREASQREQELLRHEIAEIQNAAPGEGEMEEIEALASRFRHSAELWELATRVEGILSAGERSAITVRDLLAQAEGDMDRMASRDSTLESLSARFESLLLEVEDVVGEVERYRGALDTDPGRLAQVEERLGQLRELSRKYGGSIDAANDYLDRASRRLDEIENFEERTRIIVSEIEAQMAEVSRIGALVSKGRKGAAGSLEDAVKVQMAGLGLPDAGFAVEVSERSLDGRGRGGMGAIGPNGADEVEFFFSPDSRGPMMQLRKIASGGEMSRVMLAMKIVLAEADRLPVLIFDEVDAGIGGETAATIGEKLCELTRYHQVFCVTHLPQIASYADCQYSVSKETGDGGTRTSISLLDDDERVSEICRMLGDSTGRKATAGHAKDILRTSARKKKALT